jgi:hypothetical protein
LIGCSWLKLLVILHSSKNEILLALDFLKMASILPVTCDVITDEGFSYAGAITSLNNKQGVKDYDATKQKDSSHNPHAAAYTNRIVDPRFHQHSSNGEISQR